MNKTNCMNDGGKTIDVNKINKLYNLINMNNKGSLSGKNKDKHKKINFREKFSLFSTPLCSPRNENKGNLYLKKEFNGDNTNRMMPFCLPNLLKGGTLSPSFMNGLKLKGKLNLNLGNLNQIKLKLNKHKKQNIGLNYKKIVNNNNSNTKRPMSFKRSSSTSMFNQFMNNNINKKGLYSKKNLGENKNNYVDSRNKYNCNIETKKIKQNFSDMDI